jgi:CMP-N-acetylneuraminic acid synthetase
MSGPGTIAYEMSAEKSLDIDTAFDFMMCEFLLSTNMSIE